MNLNKDNKMDCKDTKKKTVKIFPLAKWKGFKKDMKVLRAKVNRPNDTQAIIEVIKEKLAS